MSISLISLIMDKRAFFKSILIFLFGKTCFRLWVLTCQIFPCLNKIQCFFFLIESKKKNSNFINLRKIKKQGGQEKMKLFLGCSKKKKNNCEFNKNLIFFFECITTMKYYEKTNRERKREKAFPHFSFFSRCQSFLEQFLDLGEIIGKVFRLFQTIFWYLVGCL